jgi:DnaK suppressor protein
MGLRAVTDVDQAGARRALEREADELRRQITSLETAQQHRPEYGPGAGYPDIARRELDRALLERLKQHLAEVERALGHQGRAEYGVCLGCGGPIHPDRLAVLPGTELCIRCARRGNGPVGDV